MTEESTTQVADAVESEAADPVTPTETGDKQQAKDKPGDDMIPKARLDAVLEKQRAAEQELASFRQQKREQEEEAAKAAGDIDRFQSENKSLREEVEAYRKRDEARFEAIADALSDEDKDVIAALGDDASLSSRLAVAEKLQARSSKAQPESEPGFGTTGGGSESAGGLIPPSVTTRGEYESWIANLATTIEGKSLLVDRKKMESVREEAKRKKLR